MSAPVYTVRVLDYPGYLDEEIFPVGPGHQFVICAMTARPDNSSGHWAPTTSQVLVENVTTGVTIWSLPPIPVDWATFQWQGRYVLQYGEELGVFSPGWDVTITAYDLTLP